MTAQSNAILFRQGNGIPGAITRHTPDPQVESIAYSSTQIPGYGFPVKIVSNQIQPLVATGDITYGFLVRPFPTSDGASISQGGVNSGYPLNVPLLDVPPVAGVAGVLRRGYIAVHIYTAAPAPALAGVVYFWFAASSAPHVQGGIESAANASATAITGAYFTGGADANGNAEIYFGQP